MEELSKFLPEGFDKEQRLVLIAGKGMYPIILAKRAIECGIRLKLIALEDETSSELYDKFSDEDRVIINVGQIGKLLKSVSKFGARYGIMAGQVTPKRLFKGMVPDMKAIMMLGRMKRRNAETIFGAIGEEMKGIGCELIDARSFMDSELVGRGMFCGKRLNTEDGYVEHAIGIAREVARLDIGQSCIVSEGTVLAVEGFDGTDKMIERVSSFGSKRMIFAKTVKRDQDYRFDVPVIGERTIRKLFESGVENVVIEADKVIILDSEKVRELGKEFGIKIMAI